MVKISPKARRGPLLTRKDWPKLEARARELKVQGFSEHKACEVAATEFGANPGTLRNRLLLQDKKSPAEPTRAVYATYSLDLKLSAPGIGALKPEDAQAAEEWAEKARAKRERADRKLEKERELREAVEQRRRLEQAVNLQCSLQNLNRFRAGIPPLRTTEPREVSTSQRSVFSPRLLFVAVDPYRGNRLRLDCEVKAIEEALRSPGDSFSLNQLWAATFLELQQALLRYQPAVLHFSGHGTPSGELALERDPQIPSESRRPEPSDQRPAEALARMLGAIDDPSLRCVVLNACFSEVQAAEVARHVDCVIGLSAEVRDKAAIEFARGFYGALAWGKSVRAAFDLGVAQVKSQSDASLYRLIAPKTDPRTVKLLELLR